MDESEDELTRLRARVDGLEREVAGARATERLLRRERDRAQRYLDIAAVAILVLGKDQRIQLINRCGTRLLGAASESELLGRNWFDEFIPVEERESTRAVFDALMRGELAHAEHYQNRVITRSGEIRLMAWHNSVLRDDDDGPIIATLSSGEDITDQERTAQTMRESERKFRRIAETALEGVWTIDERGATTFANHSLAWMIGYTPEEMLGRPMFDFMDAEAQRTATENMERRKQGVREVHEFRLRHRDGREVWTTMATSPITDEQGKYIGALAMVTDITEKRRAEREHAVLQAKMMERQKLESLGLLAGGIAHDFNNLLAAIIGHVELACRDPQLSEAAQQMLGTALTAADRAAGLTRQLLAYAGRGRFVSRTFDLCAHTADTVHLLRASIPKRVSVELVTSAPTLFIAGDPDAIQQTTMNLVLNAVEAYGDAGGQVTVKIGSETLDGAPLPQMRPIETVRAGEYVYVEVQDQGPGIGEQTLAHLFEPFFTTKARGRGLGLAACLGVVRSHRGYVSVHSVESQGTTFRVFFPRVESPSLQPSERPIVQPRIEAPMTVLVVDDEPDVRASVRGLLLQHGHHVWEADSGDRAIHLLREHAGQLDAVLLDVSMPGRDGPSVLKELRTFAPELPVLIHSGDASENAQEQLKHLGIGAVLQKPYRGAQLLDALQRLRAG